MPAQKIAPFFDFDFYQSQSGQKFPNEQSALEHFMEVGWKNDFSPCESFSVEHYLSAYPDIRDAGVNPLLHFLDSGWQENRRAFSVSGHINELIGYRREQFVSLGRRPLTIHLMWSACNRLTGWVANMQSHNKEVEVYASSRLIGKAHVQIPSPSSKDMEYHHFEFFVERPVNPVRVKFDDGNNCVETTLNTPPPAEPVNSSVEEFLQRAISPNTTAVAPFSKGLIKAFIAEKWKLVKRSESVKNPATMVSIVMPVFNRESLVASAITSVARQRYNNWELIIVDDGSTDKSLDAISQTIKILGIESKTKVLALENNAGVSHARNQGLNIASAPIIAYLDSDNTWDRDYLSLVVDIFETNPEANTVYAGQYVYFFNEVTNRRYLAGIRLQPFNRELLEQENYIDLNVFAHRRILYEELGGFNEKMRRLVDWDLILKYSEEQHPRLIPALLAQYNMGIAGNQITNSEDLTTNLKYIHHMD